MEQKQYNLKNALSLACDIFDKQGYKKENDPVKGIETNKSILGKRLDAQSQFVHPNIDNILSFKNELVFKKLSGKISDYEHLVIKTLEKEQERIDEEILDLEAHGYTVIKKAIVIEKDIV